MLGHSDRGAGPAFVFLHGMGSDRRRWDPVVDPLTSSHRCVSVDLPGHGESPDDGCDSLSAALAVHELVGHLGLEAPTLVGHSLGANVALLYAALFRPASVVAVDPAPLHLPHLARSLAPFADRLRGDDFAAAFAEWEHEFALRDTPGGLRESLTSSLAPRQEVVLSYWKQLLRPEDAAELQPQFTGALTSIEVPALICLADEPTAEDAAILAGMPTARVEVHAGKGHYLHLVDAPGFAARLGTWHADHRPAPSA